VNAIWMAPAPHESEPLLESGAAAGGEATFVEGAATGVVSSGDGVNGMVSFAAVVGLAATALGLALLSEWLTGAGARPGK
jgi:hypothetical protein